jgi:hydroxymethylpyrimidine pyrophosphatase-like HAD family hydrolase
VLGRVIGRVAGCFQAIGLDLDETLTQDGTLSVEAIAAVDEARDGGMTAILVSDASWAS